jgi:very-short-patch-repair endonuclease
VSELPASGSADLPSPRRGEGGAKRRVRAERPAKAIVRARVLRAGETLAEHRFWNLVRNRGFGGLKFVRQYPIGPYIADFVCRELMLVIELDGSQHAESRYDEKRSAFINGEGYSVLRFWNSEILRELDGVREFLRAVAEGERPSPGWRYSPATLSPEGERGAAPGDNR